MILMSEALIPRARHNGKNFLTQSDAEFFFDMKL